MQERQTADESQRLPNVYTSPDETVAQVGARPFPPREAIRQRSGATRHKISAVVKTVIDRMLWEHALDVAGGDHTLLVPRSDGSVIIANTPKQAQWAKRDPAFGSIEPPGPDNPGGERSSDG